MKLLVASLVVMLACAASTRYVNVASVRREIGAAISREPAAQRRIVSMGHTTNDSAVVYTQVTATSPRVEETWVRGGSGWMLTDSKAIGEAGTPRPPSAN